MVSMKLEQLWEVEESYWQQRSQIKWVREGDANTAFFHQSTLQRRRRNKVVKLKDRNDVWIDNLRAVRHLVEEYFANIFTSSGLRDWGP